MAKITLENGMVIEGTIEELKQMGVKFPVAAEEQAPKYERIDGADVRVGDFVKFIDYKCDTTVGRYYEITGFDSDGDPTFKDDEADTVHVYADDDDAEFYRLVAGTSELQAEEVAEEEPKLKVGDVVRLNIEDGESPYYGWGSVKNGDVGEIKGVYERKVVVDFENQSGWHANPTELTRLTDEEVSAAKAHAEAKREADRWEKIGRGSNHIKVGDVVRIKEYVSGHFEGAIGIVTAVKNSGDYRNRVTVKSLSGEWAERNVELITPVESRFDLAQDDAK